MLERRKYIRTYLNSFIPIVISNLISEYDYYVNGKCEITLEGHFNAIYCCNFLSYDREFRIVSVSNDNSIKIWNIQTGKCELTIENVLVVWEACFILPDRRIIKTSDT